MRELMVKAALDDPRRVFGRWDAIEVGDLGIRLLLGRGDAGGAKILDNCVDTEVVIRPVAGGGGTAGARANRNCFVSDRHPGTAVSTWMG